MRPIGHFQGVSAGSTSLTTRVIRSICLLAGVVTLTGLTTIVANVPPAAAATSAVVGSYNVDYGNQAIVKVVSSGGSYSIISKTPIQLGLNGNASSSCYLPYGTLLATFSGSGPTYAGQHGLWYNSDCSFGQWDPGTFTLSGSTLTFTPSSNAYQVVFTRQTSPPTPSLRSMGLLTWQTVESGATVVESCTATVVDSPNLSTIITAAHCFNSHGNYQNLQFAPAHAGSCLNPPNAATNTQEQVSQCGSNPYGVWYANTSNVYIPSTFVRNSNGANTDDFAFVVLAPDPANGPVEDVVGGFALLFDPNASTTPSNDPEYLQTWRVSAYGSRDENWASEVASVSNNPQNAGDLYYQPFGCDVSQTTYLGPFTGHWNDQIAGNCDFIDPLSGTETPFQMPPLPSGVPAGASGAPWTNNQNSSTGAYTVGAVEGSGACTGQCNDPNGSYLSLVLSNVLNSDTSKLYNTAGYAPTPYRQAYTCSSGSSTVSQEVTVSGQARSNSSTSRVALAKVTYAFTNPTGLTATISSAKIYVPDPAPVNTPYVSGSAATAAATGWSAGHDSVGVYVSFSGTLTVGPGQTVTTPALSASYSENGPTGTKVAFRPGPGTVSFSSPAATFTCTPNNPVVVFAKTHY